MGGSAEADSGGSTYWNVSLSPLRRIWGEGRRGVVFWKCVPPPPPQSVDEPKRQNAASRAYVFYAFCLSFRGEMLLRALASPPGPVREVESKVGSGLVLGEATGLCQWHGGGGGGSGGVGG